MPVRSNNQRKRTIVPPADHGQSTAVSRSDKHRLRKVLCCVLFRFPTVFGSSFIDQFQQMRITLTVSIFLICANLHGQVRLIIKDSATSSRLPQVSVFSNSPLNNGQSTDALGRITILVPPDSMTFNVWLSAAGYYPRTVMISASDTTIQVIEMIQDIKGLDNVTVVASTRTGDPVETSPAKVEVLGLAEMNEESMVKPGNISSLLGDISGVQVQQSSAVSGNTNVRILGLDGKYTQLLRDGMPIYDGFSGGFGVLSIQPLDLQQLELIKGSASTLYGGGAIAGLINFVSKKPSLSQEVTVMLNQSTRNETNINFYAAKRSKKFGYTFFFGQSFQNEIDVNKDTLSELPRLTSTTLHPTLFFYPTAKTTISIGYTGSFDKRIGGDMIAIHFKNDPYHAYFENNSTQRNTFSLISESKVTANTTFNLKGSFSQFNRNIVSNTDDFKAAQKNIYGEASIVSRLSRHTLIGGMNLTGDYFKPSFKTPAPVGTVSNTTLGIFVQDTWNRGIRTKLETGVRVDKHLEYGVFVLPRVSILHKFNEHWGSRIGFGLGYKAPNPLTPQLRDYDIYDIHSLPANIKAEKSAGGNIEANYKTEWSEGNRFFINHAFFYTTIRDAVIGTETPNGQLAFSNTAKHVATKGFDTYIQMTISDFEFYLGYTYTDAKRKYLALDQFMPLTPKNRAATTLVYEPEGNWRIGFEASFNSRQKRDDDKDLRSYYFLAAMIEKKFGKQVSVILNGENLLDERQSRYESLYTGTITDPKFRMIGTPIDGRVINVAVRWRPFSK
ncbi:MAG: TonB-dependent receptor [Chitinophagaceae bacterium]|nr:MAG: TonB-dependent receptor [Chitinophagaceae bacterium]